MNFKRQNREAVDVNLTPLIDIVFLLLIFFMVSTTFTKENHLSIDLPEATAEASETQPQAIEILISASGEYSINDQTLINHQLDTLKRGLQKALANRQTAPVVITADAKTPHEAVVRAMDAAGQLGLVNLSITTRQPGKSE
ncbi:MULTISPECIES: ExbD/TolR family protein [Oceanospirillaceae]|uniref:ExbD/TolR family protein n=1 Tax=Oceanospirillaceae TaxID=135620 RepID=UPI001190D781|nr:MULTISPECIES: biopolymer transporter ExbD [Thalassolituus]MBU2097555.1 biopolymer transporter ExbD [Gammaproteobacteria bacterium]MCB2387945.1 biopolymer transporter ExbD [Thalassolituus alkanivorans]MCB2422471.1 biopolymer transporter ExbD [Thalassolituus alkanivorans]TVV43719.1 biopolymer transporter ExbD [Thalassolituus sp. C2-1]